MTQLQAANNQITERTPDLIAIEINNIKEQTRKIFLFNSIEIGTRLAEAKQMLPHGEWGDWLEKSVDYSQRTASNLIRVAEEYGSKQITLFGDNSNSQAFANLSYTQAVALLGVPAEEREAFVEEHDVESMSTRELEQAIKEKKQLEKELEESQAREEQERQARLKITQQLEEYERETSENEDTIEQLRQELAKASASGNDEEATKLQSLLDDKEQELKQSLERVSTLEEELKAKPIEVPAVIEKVPEEIEQELAQLRELAKDSSKDKAEIKFSLHFDTLVKNFSDLLASINEIEDPDTQVKYKNATQQLVNRMAERVQQ